MNFSKNFFFAAFQWILHVLLVACSILIVSRLQSEDVTAAKDPMSKYVNVPGSFQSNPADYKDNTSHSKEHSSSPTNANFSQPNLWSRAWVDYYLVLQIGVSSFAIFSLYLYSLAPKYKQPHLIIPNIVALAVGTVANLLGFSLIVRIPRNRRFIHSVEHFIAYQMALVLFSCIIHLICLSKAYQTYSTYFTDSETLT